MTALATRAAAPVADPPAPRGAHEPPEARGLARDAVRLMVAGMGDGRLTHARFRDLPDLLAPGDLLVVNDSATIPAAILAEDRDGRAFEVRFSTPAPDEGWVVELRSADGARPARGAAGPLDLTGGARLDLVAPYASSARLWLAQLRADEPLLAHLARHGHPIRYGYAHGHWPLADHQTVFARRPGSAEMPSAARPFTPQLVTRLVTDGVLVAPVTLHTGVSSLERDEAPYPERYAVPAQTARLVDAVRGWGGRVVAVGTTVVRALETVAAEDGSVRPGAGWTRLMVTPERGVRAVDGLITGWHDPEATHIRLLEAVAGAELLERAYAAARESGYLWHEFGDSLLLAP